MSGLIGVPARRRGARLASAVSLPRAWCPRMRMGSRGWCTSSDRMFGLLTQWGLRGNLAALRQPGSLKRLSERGVPTVWIQSVRVLLDVVDDLERQLAAIETELRPIARADPRGQLLATIPGIGEL